MDECIMYAMGDKQMFLISDATHRNWQIEMDYKNVDLKAMATYHGLFKVTWMSYRLENVPVTFQRALSVILAS